jgi:NAD(P)-dependent dehydrogenase (short-subunit alcohol dehydrogenase family)
MEKRINHISAQPQIPAAQRFWTPGGQMPVAVITGASAGLGLATAVSLAERGWQLIIDARGEPALRDAARNMHAASPPGRNLAPIALVGDVADGAHRQELAAVVQQFGRLDLLLNNAGGLGPSPLPALADYPLTQLETLFRINVLAPLGLTQLVLPLLQASGGCVVNVSSDAAVEAYPGWGGYGATKAALDQLGAVLAAELSDSRTRIYGFDPGDMRTAMHQAAFPTEDISDRPEPETVVPALLRLIDERPPSRRYRAGELAQNLEVTR